MKIAICAEGNTESAGASKRYARSDYFAVYDQKVSQFTFVENKAKRESSGAGNRATKILGDLGVDVLLAPKVGPKAFDMLKAFGIAAYQYDSHASVKDVLDRYLEGRLSLISEGHAQ